MNQAAAHFEVPEMLPVVPLRELVVFPYMLQPVFMAREASIAAVEDALAGDRLIFLVAQRDPEVDVPEPDDLYRVGTVATVMRILRMGDGRVKVLVQGLAKARIESFVEQERSIWVRAGAIPQPESSEWCVEGEALMRTVRARVEELLPLKNLPPEVISVTANVQDAGRLADLVASNLKLRVSEAQEVLELVDPLARLRRIDRLLKRELEVTTVQAEIQSQAQDEMTRSQRENFLREQLRAIQMELGETDPRLEEVEEYRARIEESAMSEVARDESMRQLRRMERMHPDGPEAHVVRSYLDWMVELPWSVVSPDRKDLAHAREILDADHAHLDEIKERILEFLAVRTLRGDSRGPILCFTGPPGVGKTSLGRSIARAMGREFVRISLGGIRDEAEIRGHRRTYVGAMPGRIIEAFKGAGTVNPVFMLDEIDKLASDYRGNPSSALLEVLDPEQNSNFSDHFLGVPFDLSNVFFIATANDVESIPRPLRDRMEMIRLSGYTPEEKLEIAADHLIPDLEDEHGLTEGSMHWSPNVLMDLVTDYTREPGVRDLERKVAKVCRKAARRVVDGDDSKMIINRRSLPKLLGPPIYSEEKPADEGCVGLTHGLAWTEVGGEVLSIEATMTHGSGLVLTGQLGDVMKESGTTALTYVRSCANRLGFDQSLFPNHETHIHVPAGGIPKDGPSAGIAMATALLSIATRRAVRPDVAMTGEITLRGRVLAVGGVREKAMAALRAGIHRVILPKRNLQDLHGLPREVMRKMTFIPVEEMSEVMDAALESESARRTRAPRSTGRRATGAPVAAESR
ncbi:endopeptidase La [Myxococcota bacterium]|nr:endopeptidase La [Myxococcota bacterium]